MPSDFAVFTKLINKTRESLSLDGVDNEHGDWYDIPQSIAAGESKSFSLRGRSGASYGCEGEFTYIVDKQALSKLSSCQTNSIQSGNKIEVKALKPEALYVVSFRTSPISDFGPWMEGSIMQDRHPFWVEYTVEYQPQIYFFRLIHISASSFHVVRNTLKKLVHGKHTLWYYTSPGAFNDGEQGSYQPNVFAYDFVSPVSRNIIDVTVQPASPELEGAEAKVVGRIDDIVVFLSEWFTLGKADDAKQRVTTWIDRPFISNMPFAWNDDVQWSLKLRYSDGPVKPFPETPSSTRLELYWIASPVHIAFKNEIPIGFLRDVLQRAPQEEPAELESARKGSNDPVGVRTSGFYQSVTNAVFGNFCKKYDTISGASAFNVNAWGGIFAQGYYRAADASGVPGSLSRVVNCMDQAAMLELSCSFWQSPSDPRRTSWLLQSPFGYINTTHLVGVTQDDFSGPLISVNNPFFRNDRTRAYVQMDDVARTAFGCHVYVGYSTPFDRNNDGVFDACSGPHVGTENAADYVAAAIDTQTNLYHISGTSPGTVAHIYQGEVGTVTQAGWANLQSWDVLGDGSWSVAFGSVTASEATTDALWHLADGNAFIRVHAVVLSVAGTDGAFDLAASVQAARDRVLAIISSIDRDPEGVWVAGTFNDFGDYSLQYAEDLADGRVIVAAANTVVDIVGHSLTNAFDGMARQLFGHTVGLGGPRDALQFPVLEYDDMTMMTHELGTDFTIVLSAIGQLSVAGATCEDAGIVFDDYIITEVDGGNSTVEFKFVARELGRHRVRMHCADKLTMVCATRALRIFVVPGGDASA